MSSHYLVKMLYIMMSFIFLISCDEDYVNSLAAAIPIVFLEVTNDLDNVYLGESIDELELILKVEDSPAISLLALSVDFNPNFLQSGDITISPSEDNLFYNLNSDAIIESITETTESSFEISIGFTNNNQDSTYTYGNGEIARLFLSGINVRTEFDLSLDQVISYQGFDIDLNDWGVESPFIVGPEVPSLFFDDLSYDNGIIKLILYGNDLPKLTESDIIINYDTSILNFSSINEINPTEGDLLMSGYDLELTESQDGVVLFHFNHSDGNTNLFIDSNGSLVELDFELENIDFESESSPLYIDFNSIFSESVFDICGNCGAEATYEQFWLYDVSYWNVLDQQIAIHFGCMDSDALNYNEDAIINVDSTCVYE